MTPRGGHDAIEGVEIFADGRATLTARVRAVPEKGAANAALERLVATHFGVPKSAVAVVAGATSRVKTVRVTGDPVWLAKSLEALRCK